MQGLNTAENNLRLTHGIVDDFDGSLAGWTDSGTVAVQDEAGGVIKLTTGTTAEDEAFRHRTKKSFLLGLTKPLRFIGTIKFTDASTTTGAVALGLSSVAGAAMIADGGLSVKAGSQTTLALVKLTGETEWRCFTQVGTTILNDILSSSNKNNVLGQSIGPDGTQQELTIEVVTNASDAVVAYSIDGEIVCRHRISLSGAALATPVAFVKTTNTTAQSAYSDYIDCQQKR